MKRIVVLLPVLVALQVGVQPALAWAWPVDGPVLRPYVLGDDPYAGGQHRGIDVGASEGAPVRAPASGTISFAGTVPGGGRTLTIRTADGYAVTVLHLGSYTVARGDTVEEGGPIGTVASSGAPAEPEPYVYLGVRKADDPQGYVDPLGLLPQALPAEAPAPPVEEPTPVPAPSTQGVKDAPAASHPRAAHPVARHRPRAASTSLASHAPTSEGKPVHRAARHGSVTRVAPEPPPSSYSHAPAPGDGVAFDVGSPATVAGRRTPREFPLVALLAMLGGSALCLVFLTRVRREFGDARGADGTAPVLLQAAAPPAEDAHRLRLREEDRVVLHRDLERIFLGEGEALANLYRDDDPAEIVDVADDARSRRSSGRARRTRRLRCSVRPHDLVAFRSLGTVCSVSPRQSLSNHSGRRGRAASFV